MKLLKDLIGSPFVGRHAPAADVPLIAKALDVTDVCPPRYDGRTIIIYATIDGACHVAFIVSARTDPMDGVTLHLPMDEILGASRARGRGRLRGFAAPLGLRAGTLAELAIVHQPEFSR